MQIFFSYFLPKKMAIFDYCSQQNSVTHTHTHFLNSLKLLIFVVGKIPENISFLLLKHVWSNLDRKLYRALFMVLFPMCIASDTCQKNYDIFVVAVVKKSCCCRCCCLWLEIVEIFTCWVHVFSIFYLFSLTRQIKYLCHEIRLILEFKNLLTLRNANSYWARTLSIDLPKCEWT